MEDVHTTLFTGDFSLRDNFANASIILNTHDNIIVLVLLDSECINAPIWDSKMQLSL
jgi:hypothetical protein